MFGKVTRVGLVVLLVAWFVASIGGNLVFVGTAEAQGGWGPDYGWYQAQVAPNTWALNFSNPVYGGAWTGGGYFGGPQVPFAPGPFFNMTAGSQVPWSPYTGYVPMRGNPYGLYN